MGRRWIGWPILSLVALTASGAISAYQALFSLWMTAYPKADINFWRPHFYLRLAQTTLVGILWILSAAWLIRCSARSRN
jgi:hypothetical protein